MTDGDILKAATKIQANVRGYLQRKRYNAKQNNLVSIDEESQDKQHVQLTDDQVMEALKHLDKIEVPKEEISQINTWKPRIARSVTVDEPEHIKKTVHHLMRAHSEDPANADDNNNVEVKPTGLENEVMQSVNDVSKSLKNIDTDKLKLKIDKNGELYENAPTRPLTSDVDIPNPMEARDNEHEMKDVKQLNEKNKQISSNTSEVGDERPVSIDSSDSADTVIFNENYKAQDKSEVKSESNDPIKEYIDSINIGGNGAKPEKVNLFDIAQLRKELEEARLTHHKQTLTSFDDDGKEIEENVLSKTDDAADNKVIKEKEKKAVSTDNDATLDKHIEKEKEDAGTSVDCLNTHSTENFIKELMDEDSSSRTDLTSLPPILEEQDSAEEKSTKGVQVNSSNEIRLLHTGEFHDTVVIPLSVSPHTEEAKHGESNVEVGEIHVDSASQTTPPQTQDGSRVVDVPSSAPGQVFVIIVSGFHYSHFCTYIRGMSLV